ncbi:hypothetical protein [Haloferula sp.]|uniref:hypothetical protein n=1 Tax=Haloferula sp. TaxID=2497595 RepID=UPI00329EC4B6
MKKRSELEASRWTTAGARIDFFCGDEQVATISARDACLEVDVQGIDAPMRVRKITLLQDLDWLLLDFEEASSLHRVAVRFGPVDYDELNSELLRLIGDGQTPYFRRNRPEKNENAQQAEDGDTSQRPC